MPNSDIGEVAHAIGSITDLIGGILSRADRDGPEKELNENTINIQNSFANNNLDDQWKQYFLLFSKAGHPSSSPRTLGEADREFRHNALLCAAELIYAKRIISRLVAKSVKE